MTIYAVVVAILIICIALYFSLRTLPLLLHRKKPFQRASSFHHFTVLIPARNEEEVISNLLDSLKEQEYPEDKYDVYVLVNHCTDHTAEIARKSGADVMDFKNNGKTKGQILQQAFSQLKDKKETEAYLIFDADNLLDHQFIARMNDVFDTGAQIAQGRRLGKNECDNAVSGAYEVFYNMQNYYFNEERTMQGGSAALNGTGWMIAKKLIDDKGFDVHTMTEDLEYTAIAAIEGNRIEYAHDAVTFDEYPNSMHTGIRQLNRWIFGQVQCTRIYPWKLFKQVLKKRSGACLDMFLIFIMPVMLLFGLSAFIILLTEPYAVKGVLILLIVLACVYATAVITMGIGLRKNKIRPSDLHGGLFLFPVFMCLWVPIALVSLFRKNVKWEPIKHDRKVRIEDIE